MCRVQFKFPDNSKVIRRFLAAAPVAELFAFVGKHLGQPSGAAAGNHSSDMGFDLALPHAAGSVLSSQMGAGLSECGVANAVVVVKITGAAVDGTSLKRIDAT